MNYSIVWLAVAFVLSWNSGFIGAEYGLPYSGAFTLLFWRYWVLTVVLAGYLALRGRMQWPGFPSVIIACVVGILAHGVWLGCVLLSLQHGVPAGIVALVVALQPMTTGAFSGVVVGERTPLFRWIGLLIGFSGVAIAVLARTDLGDAESVFGYFIPFGSVVAITAASLLQRRLEVQRHAHRLPMDVALFFQSLATAIAVSVPAIFFERLSTLWEPPFIATLLWLVIGVSLAAYAFMWRLLQILDATRVASLFYLGPPITMLMAWIAFGDILQFTDIVGMTVVFAGVLMAQLQKDSVSRIFRKTWPRSSSSP